MPPALRERYAELRQFAGDDLKAALVGFYREMGDGPEDIEFFKTKLELGLSEFCCIHKLGLLLRDLFPEHPPEDEQIDNLWCKINRALRPH
jgi:hypothetical protein